ncbi:MULTISPECIES: hypothetical protein [Pseudomonadota]|uniref:Uncharacterized protein n=1 Tax=Xanthomonas translucens pv. translucens TaxID=134875 RepID=A0ABW9KXI1_XANCT|nr:MULTISPECIES: hypothetical protein [Pseudomonadota]MCC8447792.1 hypothetical protein [Xanthomonas translucens pv. translucens]MCT8273799.1 hypothetical protein [Xanthomonas translucens pv. translucens]MCT8277016.1 hypothetical protein [Xanthomonas translucens pv. translucens]MCT8284214.1 hypothetical protein [Xanthomonas translucens pv. translucens]MCT8301872.1 hypothetical protein [Xanthomonas translucens pv. translucens]
MIGAIFDGFLGGVISNLTENFLSIFSYKFIITVYFFIGFLFSIFAISYIVIDSGFGIEYAINRLATIDMAIGFFSFPLIFSLVGMFSKSLTPQLKWEDFESSLIKSNYAKESDEKNGLIKFSKRRNVFIVRVNEGGVTKVEWLMFGRKITNIVLAPVTRVRR